jgi:hypothetical protein
VPPPTPSRYACICHTCRYFRDASMRDCWFGVWNVWFWLHLHVRLPVLQSDRPQMHPHEIYTILRGQRATTYTFKVCLL